MLTEQDIQGLIQLPKVIVAKRPEIGYREQDGNSRCDLDLQSSEGDVQVFPVFIRRHLRFVSNFSIGLRYVANQGKPMTITLIRYNGPHGESIRTPDGHYAEPHIHYLTEGELTAGHTMPQENRRELTGEYDTFDEALRVFFDVTSTSNYGDYFPDLKQGRLFNGH